MKPNTLPFIATGLVIAAQSGLASVTVADRPDTATTNSFYIANRAPLEPESFVKLPIGSITPRGWLRHQLELEKDGMVGHLAEIWPWLNFETSAWGSKDDKGSAGWARVRMAQLKALEIPNTGMAVAIDLADADNPNDIHPKNKFDVGERLALWALAKDYGKSGLVYSGPLYRSLKVEDNKAQLSFASVGSGLMVGTKEGRKPVIPVNAKLKSFAIAGEDRKWFRADAVIDDNTVIVSSPDVPIPVAVRYAFSMNPVGCNLYNREGLPASPFRTDNW